MGLQLLKNLEKTLDKENSLAGKTIESRSSKTNRSNGLFGNYLSSMSLSKASRSSYANTGSADFFLDKEAKSALFSSPQLEQRHWKEATFPKDKIQEQGSDLSKKKIDEEDTSADSELSKKENVETQEKFHNPQEAREYNSRREQDSREESKKPELQEYAKKEKNKTETRNETRAEPKQAPFKEKEEPQKEELELSHKKDGEAVRSEQGGDKKSRDTESLVRISLDPERWSVERAYKLQEGRNAEQTQSILSGSKSKGESKGKGLRKNQEENSKANREERSLNSDPFEELTSLFNKEELQSNSIKKGDTQKESVLRETKSLYDELVKKAKVNLKSDGSSSASIAMRPRSLGRMTLNLEIFQKQVQAQIVVESQAIKRILIEELNYFQHELQRQGIQVETLNIRVREDLEGRFANEQKGGGERQDREAEQNAAMEQKEERSKRDMELAKNRQEQEAELERESALVLSVSAEEYEISALTLSGTSIEKHIDISV